MSPYNKTSSYQFFIKDYLVSTMSSETVEDFLPSFFISFFHSGISFLIIATTIKVIITECVRIAEGARAIS